MKQLSISLLVVVLSFAINVSAAQSASPYAGQQARDIKALSAEDVSGYLSGKGMGLAKAAELNGYAGPAHVLELASPLALSDGQRTRTEALFASMQTQASSLGRALVEEERKLDQLFAEKRMTPQLLEATLNVIGSLHAQLRATHLQAHLAQVEILTQVQNARYAELRGYAGTGAHSGHSHGASH
ncbi:MAG: hypothetical protein ACI9DC_004530 [Gammaproteobacteria bacterium]|jgi:hypothetical protein